MLAEMMSFCNRLGRDAFVEKFTGSGSETDVPFSTAKKQDFAAASFITAESQRIQAARQSGTTANVSPRARR